jgi:hypothetical protein
MAEFLLEMYVSRTAPELVEQGADRARGVADLLRQAGRPVELLRTIFMPQEETCFFVYEATSADDVREAAQLAALPWERVVEAVTGPPPEHTGGDAR